MSQIVVHDSQNAAPAEACWSWRWLSAQQCTAAVLIEERVRSECDRIRLGHPASSIYSELRGDEDTIIDTLVSRALSAFDKGRLVLIVNDRQIVGRDSVIDIGDRLDVAFVQLMPLKGG